MIFEKNFFNFEIMNNMCGKNTASAEKN